MSIDEGKKKMTFLNWYGEHPYIGTVIVLVSANAVVEVVKMFVLAGLAVLR
jgi:hypothetical protein